MTGKVGYKRPPEGTRFKKGQSGNPSGKRKKVRSFAEDVAAEFAEKIHITESGQRRRITKQRALVKAIMANGIKGNARAASLLLTYCVRLLEADPTLKAAENLTATEQKILEDFLERELQRRQAKAASTPSPAPASDGQASQTPSSQKEPDQ